MNKTATVAIPATVIASKENKKLAAKIEKKIKAELKNNGCPSTYKAFAVLMKKNVEGGMYIMRRLTVTDGVITAQEDTVEDIVGVQLGKALIGLEEVLK